MVLQGFEAARVVVSVDEVGKVPLEHLVAVVVIAFDGSFLDGPIHPLELSGWSRDA